MKTYWKGYFQKQGWEPLVYSSDILEQRGHRGLYLFLVFVPTSGFNYLISPNIYTISHFRYIS